MNRFLFSRGDFFYTKSTYLISFPNFITMGYKNLKQLVCVLCGLAMTQAWAQHIEVTAGYLINPASQLKVYASVLRRQLTPQIEDALTQKQTTTWINLGIRTDIFNWYRDF